MLRDGHADVALMHHPFDDLAGFDTENLCVEGQVALLPAGHPLASRDQPTLADVRNVADLPIARWPRLDGSYPDGPGPEVHTQSQLAQLVALGKTLLVIPPAWAIHATYCLADRGGLVTGKCPWPGTMRVSDVRVVNRVERHFPGGVYGVVEGTVGRGGRP
nr:LysR substrate-binding domain-containing protein [Frankia gtarii]